MEGGGSDCRGYFFFFFFFILRQESGHVINGVISLEFQPPTTPASLPFNLFSLITFPSADSLPWKLISCILKISSVLRRGESFNDGAPTMVAKTLHRIKTATTLPRRTQRRKRMTQRQLLQMSCDSDGHSNLEEEVSNFPQPLDRRTAGVRLRRRWRQQRAKTPTISRYRP